jgi:mannosyltransferase
VTRTSDIAASMRPGIRRYVRVEFVVGAGVAFVLGLIALGAKAWWFDEAFNVSLARNHWPTYVAKAGYYEPSQALYLILFKLWRVFTPETEWFTRLPSVLAATATAGTVGLLGARLFGRWTGVLAGTLIATNASIVAWSQQTRTYTLASLAAVVVTLLFLRAFESRTDSMRPWLVYGLVGGISIYAHFFLAFVLIAHGALFPRLRPQQRRAMRFSWALIAVACLPAAVVNVVGKNSGADWIPGTSWGRLRDAISELSGFNALALLAAAVGVAAIFSGRTPRAAPWKGTLLIAWATAPIVGALLISIAKPMVTGRYLLVAAPALAILAAAGLVAIRPRWLAAAAVIVVLTVSGREILTWYDSVPEDWRGAAQFAMKEDLRGATIALYPDANYIPYQLYAPLPAACRRVPGHHEPRCNFRARGDTTLVVTTRADWRALDGASNYVVTGQRKFGDRIRIIRLTRRPRS